MNRVASLVPPPFREWPNLIEMQQLTRQHIEYIYTLADSYRPKLHGSMLEGRQIAVLFDKSSPKTQETFVLAAESLGAKVKSRSDMFKASAVYDEEPMQAMLDLYLRAGLYSLFVLRMPPDWIYRATLRTRQPIINAGSYGTTHPTQALLDAHAIKQHRGSLNGLKLMLVGNLQSRVIRSLLYLLSRDFEGVEVTGVTLRRYALEDDILTTLKKHNIMVRQELDISEGDLQRLAAEHHGIYDVRLFDKQDEEKMDPQAKRFQAKPYTITQDVVDALPADGFIHHPLPHTELDLSQAVLDANDVYRGGKVIAIKAMTESGIAVRRALLMYLLETGPQAYLP